MAAAAPPHEEGGESAVDECHITLDPATARPDRAFSAADMAEELLDSASADRNNASGAYVNHDGEVVIYSEPPSTPEPAEGASQSGDEPNARPEAEATPSSPPTQMKCRWLFAKSREDGGVIDMFRCPYPQLPGLQYCSKHACPRRCGRGIQTSRDNANGVMCGPCFTTTWKHFAGRQHGGADYQLGDVARFVGKKLRAAAEAAGMIDSAVIAGPHHPRDISGTGFKEWLIASCAQDCSTNPASVGTPKEQEASTVAMRLQRPAASDGREMGGSSAVSGAAVPKKPPEPDKHASRDFLRTKLSDVEIKSAVQLGIQWFLRGSCNTSSAASPSHPGFARLYSLVNSLLRLQVTSFHECERTESALTECATQALAKLKIDAGPDDPELQTRAVAEAVFFFVDELPLSCDGNLVQLTKSTGKPSHGLSTMSTGNLDADGPR